MTREDVKKIFGEGITDEQITAVLNQHNSEVATEKGKAEKSRADGKANADKVRELQEQLDAINRQSMTDLEKIQADMKAVQATNEAIAKENQMLKLTASLATNAGIVGEDAKKLIASIGTDDFSTVLGSIISDGKKAAIAEFEKESMKGTPDAGGSDGGSNPDDTPDDVKNAQTLVFGGAMSEKAEQAKSYYM